jgi:hypothetical protein
MDMKNKSIRNSLKNLIKVVMISGIVVMFNIVPSFASNEIIGYATIEFTNSNDTGINAKPIENVSTIQEFCNKYNIVSNGKIDNTPIFYIKDNINDNKYNNIINYSNGSQYLYNLTTGRYIFKPFESDKEIVFYNIYDLEKCKETYTHVKELNESQILKNAYIKLGGIKEGSYNDKIYADNLSTDAELQKYASQWLKDNYNLTLDIPVYFSDLNKNYNENSILSNSGCLNLDINTKTAKSIEIEKEYSKVNILSEKTLIHELTHYALYKLGKPFDDESEEFKKECIKNGGVTNDWQYDYDKFRTHLGSIIKNNK